MAKFEKRVIEKYRERYNKLQVDLEEARESIIMATNPFAVREFEQIFHSIQDQIQYCYEPES